MEVAAVEWESRKYRTLDSDYTSAAAVRSVGETVDVCDFYGVAVLR